MNYPEFREKSRLFSHGIPGIFLRMSAFYPIRADTLSAKHTIEVVNRHLAAFVDGKCGFVSTFGESNRAGVTDDSALVVLYLPKMCMPVNKAVEFASRLFLLVIHVSVGEEKAFPFIYHQCIIRQNREIEQHLVYLCVAIPRMAITESAMAFRRAAIPFGSSPSGSRLRGP